MNTSGEEELVFLQNMNKPFYNAEILTDEPKKKLKADIGKNYIQKLKNQSSNKIEISQEISKIENTALDHLS